MDELLQQLEARVSSLLSQCRHLKQINHDLQHSQRLLLSEKEILIAKNKSAVTQIENMVSRLKLIEKST